MSDDIMKLLRGGVKVLTGGDSPQAQATGCNSLTDGIVRMGEVVFLAQKTDFKTPRKYISRLFNMSEFRRNIVSNFKRYTDGKNKVEYIVKLAMYSALAFVLYNIKFPLPGMFPSFLDIQISELPALIAGFSMGPISGCLVIIIKGLFKSAITSTSFVGELTDVLLGICFVVPSSLIYNSKKNKKTALLGLVVGSLLLTVMAIIVNRFISVPLLIKVSEGGWEPLLNMASSLYNRDITKETFYKWYLGVGILPFNLLRCFIVSAVTYFLYPRLKRPLKLETREVYEDKYTPCENKDDESADEEKTVVDTEEKDGVFTAVNTENADEISQNDDNGALNDDKDLANDDKK